MYRSAGERPVRLVSTHNAPFDAKRALMGALHSRFIECSISSMSQLGLLKRPWLRMVSVSVNDLFLTSFCSGMVASCAIRAVVLKVLR
jgi:hypothetical protein